MPAADDTPDPLEEQDPSPPEVAGLPRISRSIGAHPLVPSAPANAEPDQSDVDLQTAAMRSPPPLRVNPRQDYIDSATAIDPRYWSTPGGARALRQAVPTIPAIPDVAASASSWPERVWNYVNALDRFDAGRMLAARKAQERGQIDQQHEINDETQNQMGAAGVRTRKNEEGVVEPLRDEDGNLIYRPTPTVFDKAGLPDARKVDPSKVDYSTGEGLYPIRRESGPDIVPLDENARIGNHPQRPHELYKQNAYAPWEYVGTVDEGLDSEDDKIRSAAEKAKVGINKELFKAAKIAEPEAYGKPVETAINNLRQANADIAQRQKSVADQTLKLYGGQAEDGTAIPGLANDPRLKDTEGSFWTAGITSHPTQTAIAAQNELAAAKENLKQLQIGLDPGTIKEQTEPLKQAVRDATAARSAFNAIKLKLRDPRSVDSWVEERRQQLQDDGKDPESDPIISAVEKRKEEMGLPTRDSKQAAAESALRQDPDYAPLFDQRDAIDADEKATHEQISQHDAARQQRLEPIRARMVPLSNEARLSDAAVTNLQAALDRVVGMPPAVEGEDPDARRDEVGRKIGALTDPTAKGRATAIVNRLNPELQRRQAIDAELTPLQQAHDQVSQANDQERSAEAEQANTVLSQRRAALQESATKVDAAKRASAIQGVAPRAVDLERGISWMPQGPERDKAQAQLDRINTSLAGDDFEQAKAQAKQRPIDELNQKKATVDPTKFDTQLSPEDEARFQEWKARNVPKDAPDNYDYRGAWKDWAQQDKNGDWPAKFEKPNNETFSEESIYAKAHPDLAGKYMGDKFIAPGEKLSRDDYYSALKSLPLDEKQAMAEAQQETAQQKADTAKWQSEIPGTSTGRHLEFAKQNALRAFYATAGSMHRALEGISRFVSNPMADTSGVANWFKANADVADQELAGKGQDINPELTKTFGKSGDVAAGVSTGIGRLVALAPAMLGGEVLGPALGLSSGGTLLARAAKSGVGMIPMATQIAAHASATGYDKAIQDGKTPQEATMSAGVEAAKTLPGILAYIPGGTLARQLSRLLPIQQTPLATGISNAIFGSAANVATSAALRKVEGGGFTPSAEELTQDVAFGLHGGIHAGSEQRQMIDTARAVLDGTHPQAVVLDSIIKSDDKRFTPEFKQQASNAMAKLRENAQTFLKEGRLPQTTTAVTSQGAPGPVEQQQAPTETTGAASQRSLNDAEQQRASRLGKVLVRNGVDPETANVFAAQFVRDRGTDAQANTQRDAIKDAFREQGGRLTESGQREAEADQANQALRTKLQQPVVEQTGSEAMSPSVTAAEATAAQPGRSHVDDSIDHAWNAQKEKFAKIGIGKLTESDEPGVTLAMKDGPDGKQQVLVNRAEANRQFGNFTPEQAREAISKGLDEEYLHAIGRRVARRNGLDTGDMFRDWAKSNPEQADILGKAYGKTWDLKTDENKFSELERMILQTREGGRTTEQLWIGREQSAAVDRALSRFKEPVKLTQKLRQYFTALLEHLRGEQNPSQAVLDHIRKIEGFDQELRQGDVADQQARESLRSIAGEQPSDAEPGVAVAMAAPAAEETRDPEQARIDGEKLPIQRLHDAMPLAMRIASGYRNISGVDLKDVEQHALIALARAAKAFDPSRGVPFEALAQTAISNELRGLYRKQSRVLEQTTLDEPISAETNETRASQIRDEAGRSPRDQTAYNETVHILQSAINEFPARMRDIMNRLAADEEPGAIASGLGLSKQAISNVKLAAIKRMRGKLGERGITGIDDDGILRMANPANAFYEQDLKPGFRAAGAGFVDLIKRVTNTIAPRIGVKPEAVDLLGEMQGERNRAMYQLERLTKPMDKMFNDLGKDGMVNFIDRLKRGEQQTTPELQSVAEMIRRIDTQTWEEAKKFKPSLAWLDNHFRVLWKTIPGAQDKSGLFGIFRRPLEGSKGWQKQHTLADMSEGLARGGEPHSYNPMVLFRAAQADMRKFISAQRMWEGLKDIGLRKFVGPGEDRPEGWQKIDDRIASVWFPAKEGMVHAGDWYVDPGAARLLNNHLSRDVIRESEVGRGLMYVKNASTAAELAFSPFHAVFESGEAWASSFGLGLNKTLTGAFKRDPRTFVAGIRDMVLSPVAPYTLPRLGGAAVRSFDKGFWQSDEGKWLSKRYPDQDVRQMIEDGFNGGLKPTMHEDYKVNAVQSLLNAYNTNNFAGASLRALPAINEMVTNPLFDKFIPRLKWGLFLKEYANELANRSEQLANGQISRTQIARKVVDFVEDRFGELNFDNLYWNRTFKTSMQFLFRSVTWKLGSLRAATGALPEQAAELIRAAQEHRAPVLNPKVTWLPGVLAATVAMSQVIQAVFAHKRLETFKDLIHPQVDPDDDKVRLTVPTYMKDWYHLTHSPVSYFTTSTSGVLNHVLEAMRNRDFYGVKIRNEDDDWTKQAVDMGKYGAGMMLPFSIRGYKRMSDQDMSLSRKLLAGAGFNPAPKAVAQSDAQNLADKFMERKMEEMRTRTREEFDKSKMKSHLVKTARGGDTQPIREAMLNGTISRTEGQTLLRRAKHTPFQATVDSLTLPQGLRVYEVANDQEKDELRPVLLKKNESERKRGSIGVADYWDNKSKLGGPLGSVSAVRPTRPQLREAAYGH